MKKNFINRSFLLIIFFIIIFFNHPNVANATLYSTLNVTDSGEFLNFSFDLPNFNPSTFGSTPASVTNLMINGVSENADFTNFPGAGLTFPCSYCNTGEFTINFISPSGFPEPLNVNSGDAQTGGISSQGLIVFFDSAAEFGTSKTISINACYGNNCLYTPGSMTISPSTTPEPSTLALFGTGIIILGGLLTRKNKFLAQSIIKQ